MKVLVAPQLVCDPAVRIGVAIAEILGIPRATTIIRKLGNSDSAVRVKREGKDGCLEMRLRAFLTT